MNNNLRIQSVMTLFFVLCGVVSFNESVYANSGNITITSPGNNSTYTWPVNLTITVAGSSKANIYSIKYYINSTLLCSKFNGAPSQFTCDWKNISPGTYTVKADAADYTTGGSQSSVNVIIKTPTPSVNITVDKSSYASPATVILTASASTSYGKITKVEFYNGSTLLNSSSSSTYNWRNVSDGSYTVTARAYDSTGNYGTSSPTTVNVCTPPSFIGFDNQCKK